MAHAYYHALSSVHRWGGRVEDYLPLHQWLDGSKEHFADFRHRALRHHTEGIVLAERLFGVTLTLSTGRVVPLRYVAEQHIKEDLRRLPTVADWLRCIRPEAWMQPAAKLPEELDLTAPAAEQHFSSTAG